MTTPVVAWGSKDAAFRDLVRLTLHRLGNLIESDDGKTTAKLLAECGVAQTEGTRNGLSKVLRLMKDDHLLKTRDIVGHRTYRIEQDPLTEDEVRLLEKKEAFNRSLCEVISRPSQIHDDGDWLTPLYDDCNKALAALREAFQGAKRTTGSLALLNGSEVLKQAGIKTRKRADEVRHYLKEFGLARAAQQEPGSKSWWWSVSFEKELDKGKLQKKAMGPHAYGGFARRAPLGEDPVTRQYAKGVSSRLTEVECGPVVTRQKAVPQPQLPHFSDAPSKVSSQVETENEEDGAQAPSTFQEVIEAAEALEQALSDSETALRKLQDRLKEQNEREARRDEEYDAATRQHEQIVQEKDKVIADLRRELEEQCNRANVAEEKLRERAQTLIDRVKGRFSLRK